MSSPTINLYYQFIVCCQSLLVCGTVRVTLRLDTPELAEPKKSDTQLCAHRFRWTIRAVNKTNKLHHAIIINRWASLKHQIAAPLEPCAAIGRRKTFA